MAKKNLSRNTFNELFFKLF